MRHPGWVRRTPRRVRGKGDQRPDAIRCVEFERMCGAVDEGEVRVRKARHDAVRDDHRRDDVLGAHHDQRARLDVRSVPRSSAASKSMPFDVSVARTQRCGDHLGAARLRWRMLRLRVERAHARRRIGRHAADALIAQARRPLQHKLFDQIGMLRGEPQCDPAAEGFRHHVAFAADDLPGELRPSGRRDRIIVFTPACIGVALKPGAVGMNTVWRCGKPLDHRRDAGARGRMQMQDAAARCRPRGSEPARSRALLCAR